MDAYGIVYLADSHAIMMMSSFRGCRNVTDQAIAQSTIPLLYALPAALDDLQVPSCGMSWAAPFVRRLALHLI